MAYCIIRSILDIKEFLIGDFEEEFFNGYHYYHCTLTGNKFESCINDLDKLCSLIAEECKKSNLIDTWKEKEAMYGLKSPDKYYFSKEYFDLKDKISSDVLSSIILRDDLEVFSINPVISGVTYADFKTTGVLNITFITKYLDSIYNTPYHDKDFSSLQGYLSSHTDDML